MYQSEFVWGNLLSYAKPRRGVVKFIYSEKATKFCEITTLLLSYVVPVKSKLKISQNFVAFSEYMNFKSKSLFQPSRLSVLQCVCPSEDQLQFLQANHKMSLIKVVPYVLGMTPGVPGAPEPRMYPRSAYFLVYK